MDRRRFLELQPWCAGFTDDASEAQGRLLEGAFCCFYAKGSVCVFAEDAGNKDTTLMHLNIYIHTKRG